MEKLRLDTYISNLGLCSSRERAKVVITNGDVYVDGQQIMKPGARVSPDADIKIHEGLKYVSRGGLKLEKALSFFKLSPVDKICLDCGASTGGFTDCLLQHGAKMVYAVDVGSGQLDLSLRNNPKVILFERTNIRNAAADIFKTKPEFAVVDLSFISLSLVLPNLKVLVTDDASIICLIKPQFEAGREKVGKKGIVKDIKIHEEILNSFITYTCRAGFVVKGLTNSPIKGSEGNIEFFGFLDSNGNLDNNEYNNNIDVKNLVEKAHCELADH